jgi:hypothetical protein
MNRMNADEANFFLIRVHPVHLWLILLVCFPPPDRNSSAIVSENRTAAVSKPPLDVITCRHQMAGMKMRMHDQISRPAPRAVTDVLDASMCDLATGAVGDAAAAQQQARCMLSDFEQAQSGSSVYPRADSRCQGREGRRP